MAKIAFFSIPAYGHTNPTIAVVEELVQRGHQVRYYSFEQFRQRIEAAGAVFVPCEDAMPPAPKDLDKKVGKDFSSLISMIVDTTLALDETACRDLREWGADGVVSDSLCAWGKLFAMKLGLPYVCSTTSFAFNRYTARALQENKGFGELFRSLLGLPKISREVKKLKARGYPVKSMLDLIQNDNETNTVVYTSAMFQPMAETFSEKYAFVGPSISVPAVEEEEKRRPRVYISLGSIARSEALYENATAALGGLELDVHMVVGKESPLLTRTDLPENIILLGWAEQLKELQQADVFLSHGGMNSVSESLYFAVPLLLWPQHSEQRTVANRAVELGAGILLRENSPAAIREGVEQLLACKGHTAAAVKIRESFLAAGGYNAAADKILSIISK